ncbi:MAG: hypothetical protein LC772_04675 [Chloroflexi bacterium]|nr:hypothetical protein [Chloroflexota bacterium]
MRGTGTNHGSGPTGWELARSLVAYETRAGLFPEPSVEAAELVWQKLTPELESVFGAIVMQTLFRRALMLARKERAWMEGAVLTSGSGCVEWSSAAIDPTEIVDGATSLLGHFFGILESLIGFDLTAKMLQRIWPDA